ncbi:MAG: molybdopterin-dependent oxidoreductase, partial [Deltaproteobacteria bacterium]|nr:molybdopterin-dependent oxidoreductase [Deltaproteobacteria bacterium]
EKSSIEIVKEAKAKGAKSDGEVINYAVDLLKSKSLLLASEDPDNEKNWPRTWVIWKGNAINASAKGQEYFFRHYLGTHSNAIADEKAQPHLKEVKWRDPAPVGKMDLIVDLNFRMDTSALYSDIVLPAAHWYEKNDINTTDLHTYIHPLSECAPPAWEAKGDWEIFKCFALKTSELAQKHLPEPMGDLVLSPLGHDSPAEVSQATVKDWGKGECDLIPGKTGPGMKIITRDYTQIYNKYITYGRSARGVIGAHGVNWNQETIYDKLLYEMNTEEINGEIYPSMRDVLGAINIVMRTAPETNGEAGMLAFASDEKKTGVPMMDLGAGNAEVYMQHEDIQAQQRRTLTSACWSGICNNGRAYSPFTMNVDRLKPWRTLTGRQSYYFDHEGYLAFGEHLPTFKPKADPMKYGDIVKQQKLDGSVMLNYLTPHGKWHIHSTYYDNLRMLTLSRGQEPFWLSETDADDIGVQDNDWIEAYNDHGVVVTRAVVSARVPKGVCIFYHAPERTISFPKSPLRGMTRGGTHNSLTRTRLNPILLMGGYGQFTFGFNYWGPTGVNRDTHILVRKLKGKPQF